MDNKDFRKLIKGIVVQINGCWDWQRGTIGDGGYGQIWTSKGSEMTHRAAWRLFYGEIPEGRWVLHKCDRPICCNPEHLFLGDIVTNTKDRHAKGRDASGQRNGNAKLTDAQVVEIRQKYDGQYGRLKQLAAEYGVSSDQIRNIVRGKQRMAGAAAPTWTTKRRRRIGNEYLGGCKHKEGQ